MKKLFMSFNLVSRHQQYFFNKVSDKSINAFDLRKIYLNFEQSFSFHESERKWKISSD